MKRGKLFTNTSWRAMQVIIQIASSASIFILYTKILQPADYGTLTLVITTLSMIQLFSDFGLPQSASKYIAEFISLKKANAVKSLIYFTTKLLLIWSALVCATVFVMSDFIAKNVFHNIELSKYFKIGSLYILFQNLINLFQNILTGFQKFKLMSVLDIIVRPINFLIILIMMVLADDRLLAGLCGTILGLLFIAACNLIVILVRVYLQYKEAKKPNFEEVKPVFKYGIPILLTTVLGFIYNRVDTIFLGHYASTVEIGLFNFAFNIYQLPIFLVTVLAAVIAPVVTTLWTENRRNELQRLFERYSSLNLLLSVPIFLIMFYAVPFIILKFFVQYSQSTLFIKLFSFLIFFKFQSTLLFTAFLYSTGNANLTVKIFSIAAGLKILINFFLIPKYHGLGAAISVMIIQVFVVVAFIISLKQKLDLKYRISYRYLYNWTN